MFCMSNLRAKALAKAVLIVGGLDALAEKCHCTPAVLRLWIRGDAPVPPEAFLRATEIITDAGVAAASKSDFSKTSER